MHIRPHDPRTDVNAVCMRFAVSKHTEIIRYDIRYGLTKDECIYGRMIRVTITAYAFVFDYTLT